MDCSTEYVQQNDGMLADSATSRPKKRTAARCKNAKRAKRQFRNLVDKETGKSLQGKELEDAQRRGDVMPKSQWSDHRYVDSKTGEDTQLTGAEFDAAKKSKKVITFGAYRIRQYKKRKAGGNMGASSRVVVQASPQNQINFGNTLATDPLIDYPEPEKELPVLPIGEVEEVLDFAREAPPDNAVLLANVLAAGNTINMLLNTNPVDDCFLLENDIAMQQMLGARPFLIVEDRPVSWLVVKLSAANQLAAHVANASSNPNAFFNNPKTTDAQESRVHTKLLGLA